MNKHIFTIEIEGGKSKQVEAPSMMEAGLIAQKEKLSVLNIRRANQDEINAYRKKNPEKNSIQKLDKNVLTFFNGGWRSVNLANAKAEGLTYIEGIDNLLEFLNIVAPNGFETDEEE